MKFEIKWSIGVWLPFADEMRLVVEMKMGKERRRCNNHEDNNEEVHYHWTTEIAMCRESRRSRWFA